MHEPSPEAIRGGCPCGLWSPRNCAYTKAVGLCNPARNRAPGRPPRRDDEALADRAARPAVADAVMADLGAAITEGVTEVRLLDLLTSLYAGARDQRWQEAADLAELVSGDPWNDVDPIRFRTWLRTALGGEG